MLNRMSPRALLITVMLVLAGCAGGDAIVGPTDSSRGMIVGAFDYSDSAYVVTGITLSSVVPTGTRIDLRAERVHIYDNGIFVADDLAPGRYRIYALRSDRRVIGAPRNYRAMQAIVFPGQVTYMGTYHVVINPRRFGVSAGSLDRTDRAPNERDVLEQVRAEAKDTAWVAAIDRRLALLNHRQARIE